MKKNTMMKIASVLMIAVLLTTCVISGTFAKYTTQVGSDDAARVAKWGFNTASINFEDLFASSYNNVAAGDNTLAIIAPGTSGSVAFEFDNTTTAPEVAYTFKVDTTGSACATNIQNNTNITWALAKTSEKNDAVYGTWEKLIADIEALSGEADGEKAYAANEIPAMVDTEYTILWKWNFSNTDDGNALATNDSYLGNEAVNADQVVTLKITITAEQVAG